LLVLALVAMRQGRRAVDPDPRRAAALWAFVVLEILILLDAWFTGAFSPVGVTGAAADTAAVVFVILGDLRFFYLVERQRGLARPGVAQSLRALAVALPVSLIVPIATAVLRRIDAQRYSGNYLYLLYELGVLALAIVFSITRIPKVHDGADGRSRYVQRLLALEITQYGAWILADLLILRGIDLGWALRIVPNTLYYACFVPVATLAAPPGTRT